MRKIKSIELTENTISNFVPRGIENSDEILTQVKEIVQNVRNQGEIAIRKYTNQFDHVNLEAISLKLSNEEIRSAYQKVNSRLIDAIRSAKSNIEKFHLNQIRPEWYIEPLPGVKTGQIMRPLDRVGLYIPGGKAVYPSSVLMTAAVAKIAGVKELILCSPPQLDGDIAASIVVAADICNVNSIFRCGGAQAIAGMAFGTESIPKVQKIFGPGNKYVAAAKQVVSDRCAIDNPAGPSEILLIVDDHTNPLWAAYDLLAQIEHGEDNIGIIMGSSLEVLNIILTEVEKLVPLSNRKKILEQNLTRYGLCILAESQSEMIRIINLIAPEHLHFHIENPRKFLPEIRHAGAIFLGSFSPVPLGDYCAGTNHVLPTAGYARTYSGLSVLDFMKTIDILECSKIGLSNLAPILEPLAEFEGLLGHRDAVLSRMKNK